MLNHCKCGHPVIFGETCIILIDNKVLLWGPYHSYIMISVLAKTFVNVFIMGGHGIAWRPVVDIFVSDLKNFA